jgi:predicted nucleic acid-binding protein
MNRSCFIDSNLWLYVHLSDQDPDKRERLRPLLSDGSVRRVISTQVAAEVAANLVRKGRIPEPTVRMILTTMQQACDVVPVTVGTGIAASHLREAASLSYWDSLIVASALEAGCSELWSEDLQTDRVFAGRLRIINPIG